MRDADTISRFAIGRLGRQYAIRQNLDLARLLFPWSILPRRWRSCLFERSAGYPTKEICSSMIAEAFSSVNFPILPIIKKDALKGVRFYHRNPRLFTPRDFDYSPYFEIIKYPLFEVGNTPSYRNLPWSEEPLPIAEDGQEFALPPVYGKKTKKSIAIEQHEKSSPPMVSGDETQMSQTDQKTAEKTLSTETEKDDADS